MRCASHINLKTTLSERVSPQGGLASKAKSKDKEVLDAEF